MIRKKKQNETGDARTVISPDQIYVIEKMLYTTANRALHIFVKHGKEDMVNPLCKSGWGQYRIVDEPVATCKRCFENLEKKYIVKDTTECGK